LPPPISCASSPKHKYLKKTFSWQQQLSSARWAGVLKLCINTLTSTFSCQSFSIPFREIHNSSNFIHCLTYISNPDSNSHFLWSVSSMVACACTNHPNAMHTKTNLCVDRFMRENNIRLSAVTLCYARSTNQLT
jgi:hypothetical protein